MFRFLITIYIQRNFWKIQSNIFIYLTLYQTRIQTHPKKSNEFFEAKVLKMIVEKYL